MHCSVGFAWNDFSLNSRDHITRYFKTALFVKRKGRCQESRRFYNTRFIYNVVYETNNSSSKSVITNTLKRKSALRTITSRCSGSSKNIKIEEKSVLSDSEIKTWKSCTLA